MNQYVTKIDLTSNGLGDEGIMYLSLILRDNTAVVDIDLSQNFISIDGARALHDMLKDNITINHLRLDGKMSMLSFFSNN
jgi:Ran GTPase-activating protein (RanGAP) involved in mRNA processing and transport